MAKTSHRIRIQGSPRETCAAVSAINRSRDMILHSASLNDGIFLNQTKK